MGSALRFKQNSIPRQNGEKARLKVVQGPDYGATYVVTGVDATVGRGEENDVVIADLKTSRRHARFKLIGGAWNVSDMGSANGILHNGKASRAAPLKTGDTITLGETTLEFVAADVGTLMLVTPPSSLSQIKASQEAFAAQKSKVRSLGSSSGLNSSGKKSLFKSPLLLIVVIGGAAAMMFLDGGSSSKPVVKKAAEKEGINESRDLAAFLPKSDPAIVGKTVDMFFKEGFREYREKNYLRAKVQFETVLQMSPGNPLATLYLENADKSIKEEVQKRLQWGIKAETSGKLREARGHFEAVMRLLYRDPTKSEFIEAKDQIEKIEKALKEETS